MQVQVKYVESGKVATMHHIHADILERIGVVRRAEVVTRDLKAEEDSVEISPRTGKPKRKYTRRDMKADD